MRACTSVWAAVESFTCDPPRSTQPVTPSFFNGGTAEDAGSSGTVKSESVSSSSASRGMSSRESGAKLARQRIMSSSPRGKERNRKLTMEATVVGSAMDVTIRTTSSE